MAIKHILRVFVASVTVMILAALQALPEEKGPKPERISEDLFRGVLDCLVNRGDWFAPTFTGHKLLHLRYAHWVPDPDFRQEDAVFVAAYRKDKLEGEFVHVVVEKEHGKPVLYVVSNTHFVLKNGWYELETPLGGLYIQGRIRLALKQMEKMNDLEIMRNSVGKTHAECHFYDEESTASVK